MIESCKLVVLSSIGELAADLPGVTTLAKMFGLIPKLLLISLMVLNLLRELNISSSSFSFLYCSTVLASWGGGGGGGLALGTKSIRLRAESLKEGLRVGAFRRRFLELLFGD